MTLIVREADAADAWTIVALARALSQEEGYPAPVLSAADVRAEGFGERPRFRVLIAERDGTALGYALYLPATIPTTPPAASTCRISMSSPRPAVRGSAAH